MNKHIVNAIRETREFPGLQFELVVVVNGARVTHKNLTAKHARRILRTATDVVQLVTG